MLLGSFFSDFFSVVVSITYKRILIFTLGNKLFFLNNHVPFFDRMTRDDPSRNVRISFHKELGRRFVGKDKESSRWDFHPHLSRRTSRETLSVFDQLLGQTKMSFTIGSSFFQDVRNVIVTEQILCRTQQGCGRRVGVAVRWCCQGCHRRRRSSSQKGHGRHSSKRKTFPHVFICAFVLNCLRCHRFRFVFPTRAIHVEQNLLCMYPITSIPKNPSYQSNKSFSANCSAVTLRELSFVAPVAVSSPQHVRCCMA